ncbi:LysM peptidoglycan-binding domain-containing protein [Enterococcus sp. DIV1420a]|uniref:LysM peptidoglycan-binding domain-containing protein n=2 Tax=Enterococcus TaxID=1350 RepID=UPI003F2901E1
MKKSSVKTLPSYNEPKYRAKMYKKGKKWLIKGLLFSSLMLGGLALLDTESVYADEWVANSVESIQAKLVANQSSYTFEEGDTFYNISLAVNVKWQKLMELNGFEEGSQYNVPVGTTISFDGIKVKIIDSQGKVVSEAQLTPADKVDPNQTFGQQVTDVPSDGKSSNATTPSTVRNNAKVSDGNTSNIQLLPSKAVESPVISKEEISGKKNELKDLEDKREVLATEKAELERAKQEVEELLTDSINQSNEWRISALTSQKSALTQRVNGLQNDLEEQRARLQVIDEELTQAQNVKNEIVNQLSTATTVYQNAQQKIEELKTKQSALKSQLANLPEDQVEQRQALESQLASVEAMLEVADNSGSQLAELNERLNQSDNRINQLINEKETKQNETDQLQEELSQAQEQLAAFNLPDNEKGNTKQEALEQQQQLASYSQEIAAIDTQLNQLNEKIATLITEIDTLEKNDLNEKNILDDIQSKFLTDAKVVATAAIHALLHLSLNEKEEFILQVKNATTNQQVLNAYLNAVKQNEENLANGKDLTDAQALTDAKTVAKEAINALTNLSSDEKNGFTMQVDNAGTTAEVEQAQQTAATKDAENKAAADAQALTDAKTAAKEAINALTNLSADEKTAFTTQVDNAGTTAEVEQAQQTAATKDAENKAAADAQALTDAKTAAKEAINALTNLSADEKTAFTTQVDNAGTTAEVEQAQQTAATKDAENKAAADAQALTDAKTAAKEAINALTNLSSDEKNGFTMQVDNAGTTAEVEQAQQTAATKDAENKAAADAQALTDAKTAAKEAINALTNLSADEKTAFTTQVDNAGTTAEVEQAQQTAATKDAENKAAADAQALTDAKTAAKEAINALTNLSSDEKNGFTMQVDNAGTADEVTQAQQAAEAQALIVLNKDYLKITIKGLGSEAKNVNSKIITASEENDLLNKIDNINNMEELNNFEQVELPLLISKEIRKLGLSIYGVEYTKIVAAYTDSATATSEDARNILKNLYVESITALLAASPLKTNIDLLNYFNNTNALLWLVDFNLANKYKNYGIAANFRVVFSDIINVLTKP